MSYFTNFVHTRDIKLFYLINQNTHSKVLDIIMKNTTHLGSTIFCIITPIAFMLFGSYWIGTKLILYLFINQLFVQLIKRLVNRPRPYNIFKDSITINPPNCQYSFPSGHTSAAFTIALVLGHFFPIFSLLFAIIAILVGISRIYLGVHYPSDVIIGGLIAYLVFIFTSLVL